MTSRNWKILLDAWLQTSEKSFIEWKLNYSEPPKIGEYISALSNSAALEGVSHGYLIWGIEDLSREVKGTSFRPQQEKGKGNQSLIMWLSQHLRPSVVFNFHEIDYAGKPLVILEIASAAHTPVAFDDFEYLRIDSHVVKANRHPERLAILWQKLRQPVTQEWTGERISSDHSLLSSDALAHGRNLYAKKHPHLASEIKEWSELRFLFELRLTRDGELTRAALILFGVHQAVNVLGGVSPRITWKLQNADNLDRDYAHFELPFVTAVDQVISQIRRLTVRILPPRQLAPLELSNYDDWVIREALLNCIAHQDYAQGGRVVVTERPDTLEFFNYGTFLPGKVERLLTGETVEQRYRNPCLVDAMVKLGLIDTVGSGIKRMYQTQRDRFFPLPDFQIDGVPASVKVRLYGREIDSAFSSALFEKTDLGISEVIALDRIQKKLPIDKSQVKLLRAKKLIEGRGNNLSIGAPIARAAGHEVSYTRHKKLDAQHYKALVIELLKLGPQRRRQIDSLLADKLPESIQGTDKGKLFIKNLLQEMARIDGSILAVGHTKGAQWCLKIAPK